MSFSMIASCSSAMAEESWYTETLYDKWRQCLKIDKVIYEEKTDLQDLLIFENEVFGRVLALDGVIQTTEKDEFIYQEMLAHVPLLAHGHAEKVLIVGGGDGAILREVVRHQNIKRIVLVEIDGSVIDFIKKWMPELPRGAFEDPRVEVIIADGADFVKETEEKFDVIICDSTDPEGPGEVLFSRGFYEGCKNVLAKDGIFVNQNGVPFLQGEELTETYLNRAPFFEDTSFYLAPMPTYIGGFMALGWGSDSKTYRDLTVAELKERLKNVTGEMKYYTPEVHLASFALPVYIQKKIPSQDK